MSTELNNEGNYKILETLFDSLPYLFFKNISGVYTGGNTNQAKAFGFNHPSEFIGKTIVEILEDKEAAKLIDQVDNEVMQKGTTLVVEETINTPYGIKIFLSQKKPLYDEHGHITGMLGFSMDITEIKEKEKKTNLDLENQKEKERLDKIIHENKQEKLKDIVTQLERNLALIPSAFYWKDTNHRFLGANEVTLKYMGFKSSSEMIGKTDHDIWPPEYAERFIADDIKVIETGQIISKEDEYTDVEGNVKYCQVIKIPLYDEENKIVGVIGNSIDTTHQKEVEHKISQLIDTANASIFWKDKEGRYLGCNQYVLDIAGLSNKDQIIGKTDAELVWKSESTKVRKTDKDVIKNGRFDGEEEFTIRGITRTFACVKTQLLDNKNNVIGTVGTAIDITEKKAAEQLALENQQQKIEQQKKLITLAHTVAHDISSPLTALSMMMHACDELHESKRTVIKKATESILDIANNLLSTYRNEEQLATSDIEQRQPLLISDLIIQLLSEKKVQYIPRSAIT